MDAAYNLKMQKMLMKTKIYQQQTVPVVGRVSMFASVAPGDKCMHQSSSTNLIMESQYKI